jgi:MATE family multidrug resistance protein
VLFPQSLFGLLTSHDEVVVTVQRYVGWLIPTLGLGAIAYMLDGYFLGLTAGKILRNATVLAAIIGFLPLALVAAAKANAHLLWLALACLICFPRSGKSLIASTTRFTWTNGMAMSSTQQS